MKRSFLLILTVFVWLGQSVPLILAGPSQSQRDVKVVESGYIVQPTVGIPKVSSLNPDGTVDVTVEIASASEVLTKGTVKETVTSGVYDLRLFRDGQLVGVSIPKNSIIDYIKAAPAAVEKDRLAFKKDPSNSLLNTEEDKVWRAANDMAKVVKFDLSGKGIYTFKNIKLPRDGRIEKEVEFSAYAFNADRVKSDTARTQYRLPESITSQPPRKGRAFVVSIGVNASENSNFDTLEFAANDARKMQEIVTERLRSEEGRYSDIIQVPLISNRGKDGSLVENTAQKGIIKGVFSLLAGRQEEVPTEILNQIPNRGKIIAVEPEDTLIITYSGHGYADQAGIFYLLPYDIGESTKELTTAAVERMISSDELSLWMRDITATEMIMVIDACHSASVVGGNFKPGPMGSRGLGQLSYDKGMKILSATQADNVALETNCKQQGLLSYALLQDGIKNGSADANKDGQLSAAEWLTYAERRVPELYQENKDGKCHVIGDAKPKDIFGIGGIKKSNLDLQRPSLFDFRKRNQSKSLFRLP